MRSITLLLSAAALIAGLGSAQANLTLPVDREIGTLTCRTKPAARLGAGATASADCTFRSDRGGAPQIYVALLGSKARKADALGTTTISWRVSTRNGVDRPGMLAGLFSDPAEWLVNPSRSGNPDLIGRVASLKPIAGEGPVARVAHLPPRMELIAVSSAAAL